MARKSCTEERFCSAVSPLPLVTHVATCESQWVWPDSRGAWSHGNCRSSCTCHSLNRVRMYAYRKVMERKVAHIVDMGFGSVYRRTRGSGHVYMRFGAGAVAEVGGESACESKELVPMELQNTNIVVI